MLNYILPTEDIEDRQIFKNKIELIEEYKFDEIIKKYESVKDSVDLDSIQNRERVTRHDVKARIEEFCELAGYEHIHKGMTSRDLTENVEQLQVFNSLKLL